MIKKDSSLQSRDRIKARMMKYASELWGQPNASAETFDPLVGMLMGACATEIEKVSHDLQNAQSRILERLAQLLTPEVLKGARPSHAIAHASGIDAMTLLKRENMFFLQKRVPSKESSAREELTQIFFTPACPASIWNGSVKYMAYRTSLFQVNSLYDREKVSESRGEKELGYKTIYIGVELKGKVTNLKGLSFYFDWVNNPEKNLYYQLLPFAKWSLASETVKMIPGLVNWEQTASQTNEFEKSLEHDISYTEEQKAIHIYQQRFASIGSDYSVRLNEVGMPWPAEFNGVFGPSELAVLKDDLLWFRIDMPAAMPAEALEQMHCSINCFPVINRKLNEFRFRLQPNANIIPLNSPGQHFLSMKTVKSDNSETYILSTNKDIKKSEAGTYNLREGGIERFDKRSASELLNYLLDLLRDESASFAVYGNDLITANLRELQQMINALQQKVESGSDEDERIAYIIIHPKYGAENIFVEYWSTNGEFANGLRAGSSLTLYSGYEVRSEGIHLVTTTQGGRDQLNTSETLNAFRKALMTRSRVVTNNDIKLLVTHELGAKIKGVKVSKGLRISPSAKHGYEGTIDVKLIPAGQFAQEEEKWEGICRSIETQLKSEMSEYYPIRVLVEK